MPLEDVLDRLRTDAELGPNFAHWAEIPAAPPRYAEYPDSLDPRLRKALANHGIESPYVHQREAFDHIHAGRDTVIVTPTASGKTLCYNLPVLNAILEDPQARALYLFPTKALAQDQLQELHGLITDLEVSIKTFTYDGDTPGDARRKIREAGHVVITNPDMLHNGILPHHTKWIKLFENLRYIVIDELHNYRGVFGSHIANLLRRLQRICSFYGSKPRYVCCSATIANPKELAEHLLEREVALVDDNGAPQGRKIIAIYNPPIVNEQLGIRGSPVRAAQDIAIRLLKERVQTIVFAPSRMRVEILLHHLRAAFRRKLGEEQSIMGYRGGYLPNERREVERGLREGRIRGVVSTNALELGIDIGSLEASVLTGYPGTLASAWQQMGRAGRRQGTAFAVVVASSNPLNQYLAGHPDYLLESSLEAGLIDPENLLIRISHLKCAAFELPMREGETFGPSSAELLDMLADEEVLVKSGDRYHWMAEAFPAEAVSLRSAAIDNFVVIEDGPKPRVIGEVDRPSAPLLIHDEAIYMHGGVQFHVDRLDWEEKKAYVHRVDVDYYTDANLAVNLNVIEPFDAKDGGGGLPARVEYGEVTIRDVATIFKKIKLASGENVGWGKIQLPEENRHTTAYWFSFDPDAVDELRSGALQDGLRGLGHLLRHLAPIFLLCDPRDIQDVVQIRSPYNQRHTVFLYEHQPGGVGMSKRLYEIHDELLLAAGDVLTKCGCPDGCPGCVGPSVVGEELSSKRAARVLLDRLLAVC